VTPWLHPTNRPPGNPESAQPKETTHHHHRYRPRLPDRHSEHPGPRRWHAGRQLQPGDRQPEPGGDHLPPGGDLGQAGESAAEHLVKGQRIAASGRIEARSWTDDEGTRRQIWTLTTDATEWLDMPRSAQSEHSEPARRAKAHEAAQTGEELF